MREKHGLHNTPENKLWRNLVKRCHNSRHKSFRYYGGRGVRVCDRWRESFVAFLEDMGARPSPEMTIDRIDNDGDYGPGNCRWATREEQQNNKPQTILIYYGGKWQPMRPLCRRLGISHRAVMGFIWRGYSPTAALERHLACRRKKGLAIA